MQYILSEEEYKKLRETFKAETSMLVSDLASRIRSSVKQNMKPTLDSHYNEIVLEIDHVAFREAFAAFDKAFKNL